MLGEPGRSLYEASAFEHSKTFSRDPCYLAGLVTQVFDLSSWVHL